MGFRTSGYPAGAPLDDETSFAPLSINGDVDLTQDVNGTVTDIQGWGQFVGENALYSFTHDSLFGEHEKFTITPNSPNQPHVDTTQNFINLGFYGQSPLEPQNHSHSLDIYGIKFITRALLDGARDKDYFVRRFGFDFGEGYKSTSPHRIMEFIASNDLLIPVKQTGRHSIEHLDSLYLREWYLPNDEVFPIFTPAVDSSTEDNGGVISRESNGDFNYSFSLNKKTNIKRFIEDFSLETNFMPMIDKGELKFITLEGSLYDNLEYTSGSTIGSIVTTVEANDVIGYSYKKTPIDEVVNRLVIKYKKNYGSNDYEYKMNPDDATSIFPNYDMSY